mmetsp:Transcript_46945/g.105531  ORF Transcript_46945/g.105531 Transcript_46945/m.105531 type:complete len:244 (-) Transcript_46945:864-1595(-)
MAATLLRCRQHVPSTPTTTTGTQQKTARMAGRQVQLANASTRVASCQRAPTRTFRHLTLASTRTTPQSPCMAPCARPGTTFPELLISPRVTARTTRRRKTIGAIFLGATWTPLARPGLLLLCSQVLQLTSTVMRPAGVLPTATVTDRAGPTVRAQQAAPTIHMAGRATQRTRTTAHALIRARPSHRASIARRQTTEAVPTSTSMAPHARHGTRHLACRTSNRVQPVQSGATSPTTGARSPGVG